MTARTLEGFVGVDLWLTNCDRDGERTGGRLAREKVNLPTCRYCGGDAVFPVTIAGVGRFCSTGCAENARRNPNGRRK